MSRVFRFSVALLVAITVVRGAAQRGDPDAWIGTVEFSATADQSVGFITIDRVGGRKGDGVAAPDGQVDWVFIILRPRGATPAFKASGRLRLPASIRSAAFVEIIPEKGERVLFLADETSVSVASRPKRTITACRIAAYASTPAAPTTHAETAKRLFDWVESQRDGWSAECK
jgi:hypothetical protein